MGYDCAGGLDGEVDESFVAAGIVGLWKTIEMEDPKQTNPLQYQSSFLREISVVEDEVGVHIDAGPMSNADFCVFMMRNSTDTILRCLIIIGFEGAFLKAMVPHPLSLLLIAAFITIGFAVWSLTWMADSRGKHQLCGVEKRLMYLSSPATGSGIVVLDYGVTWKAVVRRHHLRKWKWRVVAKPPSLTFRLSSENCPRNTNLVVGLERQDATEIARTLNAKLAQQVATGAGGFEVIVRSPPIV